MRTISAVVRPFPMALVVLLVLLLFGGSLFTPHLRAEAEIIVHWERGELSVVASNVPLANVLNEIAEQTKLTLRGVEHLQDAVFVNLSNVRLEDGLRKLLIRLNYALLEEPGPDGVTTPVLVIVLGGESRPAVARIVENELAEPPGNEQPEVEPATEPAQPEPPARDSTTAPVFPGEQGFGDRDQL